MRDERKYRDDLERRFLDNALRTRTRGFRLLVVAALIYVRGVLSANLGHYIRTMTGQ
ncbi:hypothetical protein [Streptomyces sp. NPDC058066]|uniref:hypothetical protein n=1 Tax=Streptomyces sp. NPDC058066 TaxID=3346323 RepID=UPI0036E19A83